MKLINGFIFILVFLLWLVSATIFTSGGEKSIPIPGSLLFPQTGGELNTPLAVKLKIPKGTENMFLITWEPGKEPNGQLIEHYPRPIEEEFSFLLGEIPDSVVQVVILATIDGETGLQELTPKNYWVKKPGLKHTTFQPAPLREPILFSPQNGGRYFNVEALQALIPPGISEVMVYYRNSNSGRFWKQWVLPGDPTKWCEAKINFDWMFKPKEVEWWVEVKDVKGEIHEGPKWNFSVKNK